ncbi:Auxin efflux carrier [gut metagenome]|uniref:Auxin efflux carrier n=1 Tax=gut metagenome TaxID=749906 RepID=J9GD31_9ZZZZ
MSTVDRLMIVPLIAYGMAQWFGLTPLESGVMILFAALPTAQSCYVMTAAMRGDAASVANVTTSQTLASLVTLPLWITWVLAACAG